MRNSVKRHLEDPTPALSQLYALCTHREAEVHHHAVKADLFRIITTPEVTDEEHPIRDSVIQDIGLG